MYKKYYIFKKSRILATIIQCSQNQIYCNQSKDFSVKFWWHIFPGSFEKTLANLLDLYLPLLQI